MNNRRRAFTLIELLVVLTVLSAVFAAMLLMLHALRTSSAGLIDNVAELAQQRRFILQLRTDAHGAQEARLDTPGDEDRRPGLLTLVVAEDQQIQYRLFADRIERRVGSGSQTRSRETFAVVPVLEGGWTLDRHRHRPLLGVLLRQPALGRKDVSGAEPLRLVAALGSHSLANTTAISEGN